MAIREIEYTVSANGIVPAVEQFGGTQNEHKATKLVFRLADEPKNKISEYKESGTVVYRFDAYDGEGGLVQGDAQPLEADKVLEFYLERWQTEHGGRVRVYLIISAVVEGGTETEQKTEMELYSFPAQLRLNNLPDGGTAEDESRESVSTLATEAKRNAKIAAKCKDEAVDIAKRITPLLKPKAFWESAEGKGFVLLAGRHGIVTDSTIPYEREKIGDGVTPWEELGWWHGPQGAAYVLSETDKREIINEVENYFDGIVETALGGEY